MLNVDSSVTAKNFVASCQKYMAHILERSSQNSNLRLAFLSNDLIKNSYAILQYEKVIILKVSICREIMTFFLGVT